MLNLLFTHWQIIIAFFVIAILYSSVGFGGGSSYLAILALFGLAFGQIRATALLCNIMVVSSNVFLYYRQGIMDWKKLIPLVILSIPLAFLGGFLKISETLFFVLLGSTLLFAAMSMWFSKSVHQETYSEYSQTATKSTAIGGIIGFISGMVGIGGGIFLSPVLHLSFWDSPKKIAAASSFFILINSIFGLLGQYSNPNFNVNWELTTLLMIAVFVGGQIGHRLSNQLFSPIQLKKATAVLIAFVSLRIFWKYIFLYP